jgi:hypothetical protein
MNIKLKLTSILLGLISLSGSLQAQTVNLINNLQPFYMSNGSLLNQNSEVYIGTFGSLNNDSIRNLFTSNTAQNYSNLFGNFSILASLRTSDQTGQFAAIFGPEAGDADSPSLFAFNGNKDVTFFDNKAMQVVVLGSVNGENRAANTLEIGVYEVYDFGAAAGAGALNFATSDATDVNNIPFATKDLVDGDPAKIGANAIVGNGGVAGTSSFSLSTFAVPEPSSASLLMLGATAWVALRRLRKNV